MKVLERLRIEIDRISRPVGCFDGNDEDAVRALMEERRRGVALPPIGLNAQTELVKGRHRLDSAIRLGEREIDAIVVEYSSQEEEEADSLAENLFRRKFKPEVERQMLARLVKLRTAVREQEKARGERTGVPAPKTGARVGGNARGPERTPKGQAIKDVAAATGRSERTVERAAADSKPAPLVPPAPKPALIETRIKRLIEDLDEAAASLQAFIDEINPKAEERRDLEHALSGRPYSFTAAQTQGGWTGGLLEAVKCLRFAVEGIERARKKQRLADFAPPEQQKIRKGLGGRKLDIEVEGQPFEPEADTEGEEPL